MPIGTACIYCREAGLVRREHVVEGATAAIQFYCGRCDRTWRVTEERAPAGRAPQANASRSI
jgi:hypothetical protein